jgi:hypothetical protein
LDFFLIFFVINAHCVLNIFEMCGEQPVTT